MRLASHCSFVKHSDETLHFFFPRTFPVRWLVWKPAIPQDEVAESWLLLNLHFSQKRDGDRGKNVAVLHCQVPRPPWTCPASPPPPAGILGDDSPRPRSDAGLQLRLLFPAHHQHVVSRVINLHGDETQPDVRIREATGEAACLAQPPPLESAAR